MTTLESLQEKPCLRCGVVKPLNSFCVRRSRKDGRYCYCKTCETARVQAVTSSPESKAAKRDYDKARVAKLADKIKAAAAARYPAARAAKIANAKAWVENNPERRRAIAKSYKARRRTVERDGISGPELLRWTAAQEKVCHWCGVDCSSGFHVDHVMPLARGGLHEVENLAIACAPCNLSKQAKHPDEFRASLEVARNTVRPEMVEGLAA
jgi:5-methylcytosine-specific restriction endonuclease McrA